MLFVFVVALSHNDRQRFGLGEELAIEIRQPGTRTKDKKELEMFNNFRQPVFCQTNVGGSFFKVEMLFLVAKNRRIHPANFD